MSVSFRRYRPHPLFGADYHALRDFLIRLDSPNYAFGRWDWMITHGWLEADGLPGIGLWEENGQLIAAATYDTLLGKAYLLAAEGYGYLKRDMLLYAEEALAKDGRFQVLIQDGDLPLQDTAAFYGYLPTQEKESDAVYPIDMNNIAYTLPEGFTVTSMAETFNLYEYGRVLWKGFNHELNGEGAYAPDDERNGIAGFTRPNVNLNLKIAVVAPDGHFVSYCGMWQDSASQSALVEPVATDPDYRRMGCGKAAVLEAVKRCGALGARRALVGSSQPFYYRIGFRPYAVSTWWEKKRP
jgi:GNAT superfamily N-acetyltransferase